MADGLIDLRVDIRGTDVPRLIQDIYREQIPFVQMQTVNALAKDFQKKQRAHQRRIFDVRRGPFFDRAVKIKPFARKQRPAARVLIDPPGGQALADIITKFQTDTRKTAREGTLAIPISERRTKAGVVAKKDHPRRLNFKPHGGSGRVMRGRRRTFLVRTRSGEGFIFRRVGRGPGSTLEVLWRLQREVPIEPELDFFVNAREVMDRLAVRRALESWDRAIRTARSPKLPSGASLLAAIR